MKIKVDRIPEEGMSVEIEKDVTWLKEHQDTTVLNGVRFLSPLASKVFLQRRGRDVLVRGNLAVNIRATCVRCLDEFPSRLSAKFDLLCVPRGATQITEEDDEPPRGGRSHDTELRSDDPGVETYSGGQLDLDPILDEHLNLAVPMRFLCREDCSGLCPRCGASLNTGACPCRTGVRNTAAV
ncbi:MAG: DUF177 domain-containing protein [Nitrospirae bacterium]|nr:DUF177 domain-containing protein [Nitrospirota bacterium]